MVFSNPWMLWLLPLAVLPLLLQRAHAKHYSWVNMLPADPLSNLIGLILKVLAVLTLVFIILGLAAPHTKEKKVERIGVGAQIVLVLDRSASMDDPFSGTAVVSENASVGETKSVAAARLITEFVKSRKEDMFGMITFSNSAMYVLPLSENKKAILAAVQATGGNSLFQTNIGSGLTSSAALFDKIQDSGGISCAGMRLVTYHSSALRATVLRLRCRCWVRIRRAAPHPSTIMASSTPIRIAGDSRARLRCWRTGNSTQR